MVVGAGVVGATVAMTAARRGLTTLLLEAGDDIGAGCSYANASLLAPDHVTPLATPALLRDAVRQVLRRPPAVRVHPDPTVVGWLARLARSAWGSRARTGAEALTDLAGHSASLHADWGRAGLSSSYERIGAIDVLLRRRGRSSPQRMDPERLDPEQLGPDELRDLEPSLGEVVGGFHHPDEAVTEPRTYVRDMIAEAQRHGARIEFGQRVQGLQRSGDRITGVRLVDAVVTASHVVICTGLSGELAAEVGLPLPLRGGRGYVIDLESSADTPAMAVRLPEHRVVVTPLSDRVRVAGSIEFGAEHRPVDRARAHALVQAAARGVPALTDRPVLEVWAGERPCTSDGLPVLGRTDRAEGLSFALGHGMWGLILAPASAELVLDGLDRPVDRTSPFSPDRFAGATR